MSATDVDPSLEPVGSALEGWDGQSHPYRLPNELWPRVCAVMLAEAQAPDGVEQALAAVAPDYLPLDRSTVEPIEMIAAASAHRARPALVGLYPQAEACDV